jgi:hypothetical protein
MKPTQQGWRPFREWACREEYESWLRSGKGKYEANWNRRQMSKMVREWERGTNTQHRLCSILVKRWDGTLQGTERIRYLEPEPGD